MERIRVHELAKELGRGNREIIEFLKGKGLDVKSHMSFVDESYIRITKENFREMGKEQVAKLDNPRTEERTGKAKPEGKKTEGPKTEGQKAEAPKKKRNIIRVFHEQNASEAVKNRMKRQSAERKAAPRPQPGTAAKAARPAERPQQAAESKAAAVKTAEQEATRAAAARTAAEKPKVRKVQEAPAAKTVHPEIIKTAEAAVPVSGKPQKEPAAKATAVKTAEVRTEAEKPAAGKAEPVKAAEPAAFVKTAETKPEAVKPAAEAPVEKKPVTVQSTPGPEGAAKAEKPVSAVTETRSPRTAETGDKDRTRAPRTRYDAANERDQGRIENRGPRENRYGDRKPAGDRSFQSKGQGGSRPPRQSDGTPGGRPVRTERTTRTGESGFSRTGRDNDRNDRPQGTRFQGGRPGAPAGGKDSRQGNRFGGGQGRSQSRPGARRDSDAGFTPEMGKTSKDSKRERDRENKNKKKDFETTGSRKNNQGGRKNQNTNNNNEARLPKALRKAPQAPRQEEKKPEIKEIILPEKLTIRELADAMKMQPSVIVKKLFMQGMMVTVNHEIDFEKAQEIALEYDIIAEKEEVVDVIEELLKEDEEDEETMVSRPPVVCVMGHVDHGKTSLLDAIRNTNVTRGEAGGITQHIGASVVKINGQSITFLDTPGHEAFTAMRMRGANSTDIAILVVAADDGVMPQTVEAISHAKAAGVEIIVAINKIDKPSANVDRVKQELSEYELIAEDWGGSTPMVPVSAHTGEGIDDLLEMILLTAEVSELKANPDREARGLVIEAKLDKGKGPVTTILIQKGTLHVGDFIAAGACSGKVRAMMDDKGRRVKEAGPSMPVEILGLGDVPNAGEVLMAFESDKDAKNFAAAFVSENKKHLLEETRGKLSLDNLFDQIQASDLKELPIIIKADVQGSVEAVKQSLVKLSNEEVVVRVIHGGVGAINESDVTLAATSNAIIIGFNVKPDPLAKQLAEQESVDMRLYRVIYQAIEDVEAAMKGMLDPVYEEKVIGHGEVRQLFKASGVGTIAGSYVTDGIFKRNCRIRITREGEQVYEGALASLKRFKDDVKEVKAGYECGLVFDGFNDVKEEDRVEAYIMVEVPR